MSDATVDADLHRQIVAHALLTGLTPLIPIPFLDDQIRDVLRRRMVRQIDARRDGAPHSPLDDSGVRVLAEGVPSRAAQRGCMLGALLAGALYIARKLFTRVMRKIFFLFTLRDTARTFTDTYQLGWLVHRARHDQAFQQRDPRAVRHAIERTLAEVDPSPTRRTVQGVLRGSGRALRRAARRLVRTMRRRSASDEDRTADLPFDDANGPLDALIVQLVEALGRDAQHRSELDQCFQSHLAGQEKDMMS
ncbi:MAG: hypothetical protein AAF772_17830 [Acidobacteriota bacterium]